MLIQLIKNAFSVAEIRLFRNTITFYGATFIVLQLGGDLSTVLVLPAEDHFATESMGVREIVASKAGPKLDTSSSSITVDSMSIRVRTVVLVS